MLGAWGVWAEPERDRFGELDHQPWGLGLVHFCLGNTSEQVSFGTGAAGSTVEPATGLPGIRLPRFPPRFPAPLPLGKSKPRASSLPSPASSSGAQEPRADSLGVSSPHPRRLGPVVPVVPLLWHLHRPGSPRLAQPQPPLSGELHWGCRFPGAPLQPALLHRCAFRS